MNKTQLTEQLAKKTGMNLREARTAVNALFSTAPREGIIATEIAKGNKVQITGFGSFERRARAKRKGRNPFTQKEIVIPAAKYPAFSAGKSLKDRVRRK